MAVQRGNMAAVVGSLRGSLDWGLEGIWQSVTIITFSYLVKLVAAIIISFCYPYSSNTIQLFWILIQCKNICNIKIYHPLLGPCYDYCVLTNVLNHLHRCKECYIQLQALVVDEWSNADAYI